MDEYNVTETDTSKSVNNFGYQIRLSITKIFLINLQFFIYASRVSAYALRHENHSNNFVSRNLLLGSSLGVIAKLLNRRRSYWFKKNNTKNAMGIMQLVKTMY